MLNYIYKERAKKVFDAESLEAFRQGLYSDAMIGFIPYHSAKKIYFETASALNKLGETV